MENEAEIQKTLIHHTDQGHSEEKLDRQMDQGISSSHARKSGSIFTSQKKGKTLFQAQKKEEI